MRAGKTNHDLSYPNYAGIKKNPEDGEDSEDESLGTREPSQARVSEEKADKLEFIDTNILPFPQ
jgi:hypothetical protein